MEKFFHNNESQIAQDKSLKAEKKSIWNSAMCIVANKTRQDNNLENHKCFSNVIASEH